MQPTCPDVSRETMAAHAAYAALLLRWSASIALVSDAERTIEAINRQLDIGKAMATLIPDCGFLDLGSGNGLPAVPIAIQSGYRVELVEADRRKAAFLHTVAARLKRPILVTTARIEALPPRSARCITARAVAPLPRLLPLVHHHLAADGYALLLKGQNAAAELAAAAQDWHMDVQSLALTEHSSVLRLSGLRRRLER